MQPPATLAVSGATTLWYLARGTGIVSLLLLTFSVALGIVTAVHWSSRRWPRFSITFLHRNVSLLAVVFLVAHIATIVLDGFAPIGWKDAVVPFASPYRPLWLGLGTVAFDLVLALVATSLLRNRIGPRTWRTVHWLAYACWPVAVLHGLGTGTDTATSVVLAVTAACVALVLGCVWWRLAAEAQRAAAMWHAALAISVIAPLALVAWLALGPLASGWSRRAGTPGALVSSQATACGATTPTVAGPSSVRPADVRVSVLNASGVQGAAASTSAAFTRLGFVSGGAANDPRRIITRSEVRYRPGQEARAHLVATYVPDATLVADASLNADDAVVSLGKSFQGLSRTPPSTLPSPTTTQSPAACP
jgi:DMSO/TMAO reductase YedYZ heme-binding membrane subunit